MTKTVKRKIAFSPHVKNISESEGREILVDINNGLLIFNKNDFEVYTQIFALEPENKIKRNLIFYVKKDLSSEKKQDVKRILQELKSQTAFEPVVANSIAITISSLCLVQIQIDISENISFYIYE